MIDQEKLTQLILSGLSVKETVKKGFALGTVKQYRRKLLGKTFRKPVDYDRVDRMINRGEAAKYIAQELGISDRTVYSRITKLSIQSKIIREIYKDEPLQAYNYKEDLERHKAIWRRAKQMTKRQFNKWLQTPDGQRFLYSQMETKYLRREQ